MHPTPHMQCTPPLAAVTILGDYLVLERARIPVVNIRKRYFLYLLLLLPISMVFHELGHAAVMVWEGSEIQKFTITKIISSAPTNIPQILAGPTLTLLLCYFAVYMLLASKSNMDFWLAAIVCNLRFPVSLILYLLSLPHDELKIIEGTGVSPAIFFVSYFLVSLLPLLVVVKAPDLPPVKKISFYLYNLVIIIAELKLFDFIVS